MTDAEVGEMVGMLIHFYPEQFVDEDLLDRWINSFATVDAEVAFEATRNWVRAHVVWPTIAELHEVCYRIANGASAGRAAAWAAYAAECRRRGRDPSHEYFAAEIDMTDESVA